jgi:hypothetical protein
MANAKAELLGMLERTKSVIKCATISGDNSHWYHDEHINNVRSRILFYTDINQLFNNL